MSELDARVLQDIGRSYQPNTVGAIAGGFQLKDMKANTEMNQLKLADMKKTQQNEQTINSILKSSDLSSSKGVAEAAEKLTKSGFAQQGMDLMKQANQYRTGEYDQQLKKMELDDKLQDTLVTTLEGVVGPLSQLEGKLTPAEMDAKVKAVMPNVLLKFKQDHADNPALTKIADQFMQNPNSMTWAGLKAAEASTKSGQAAHKQRIEEMRARTQEKNVDSEIAARGRTQDRADKKAERDAQGNLTEDSVDLAARRILNGESTKDVLANFGRGAQGGRDIARVQNRFAELAKAEGLTPDEIALRQQEMRGSARAELALGEREGKIAPRVQEAKKFAELALKASNDVPRGDWKTMSQISQWMQDQASGKELGRFQAANVSLINAYAAAIGGGVIHKHDQETGAALLATANGPENYKAKVEQLITETETALKAPEEVKQQWRQTRAMDAEERARGKDSQASSDAAKSGDYSHLWK